MGAALDTVTKLYAAMAAADLNAADGMIADDCVFTTPSGVLTKSEHRMMGEAFLVALPDAHMIVDHAVENNDEVFVEGRFLGTHTGDMQSPDGTIPASGGKIDLRFAEYFKVVGGSVTTQRSYWDNVQMLTQLGAMGG
jgi:ketosteroid isomerase-like protein